MPKLLEIAELGNPILRKKAHRIESIDDYLRDLSANLIYTVKQVSGVGLAAPQVGKSLRLFIMHSRPNARYPNATTTKPIIVINPEIIEVSSEKSLDWEGCLSIPGIRGLVPRHKTIKARFIDISGTLIQRTFHGFLARIFQHEYDHLNGIVFLDRLESTKDIVTEKEYKKLLKKSILTHN